MAPLNTDFQFETSPSTTTRCLLSVSHCSIQLIMPSPIPWAFNLNSNLVALCQKLSENLCTGYIMSTDNPSSIYLVMTEFPQLAYSEQTCLHVTLFSTVLFLCAVVVMHSWDVFLCPLVQMQRCHYLFIIWPLKAGSCSEVFYCPSNSITGSLPRPCC